MPGSSRPKRKPPAPNDATPRRAPLPTADDPPPTGRELDDRKHFLTYWQPVPPPITDDEAREYIERFDRLSIGRGPAESQLPTDEALTEEERWQRSQGWTPYELLTHAMHQPFLPFRDRIGIAKALLPYQMSEKPKRIAGVEGEPAVNGSIVAIGSTTIDVSKLSDKELEMLSKMLEKASKT